MFKMEYHEIAVSYFELHINVSKISYDTTHDFEIKQMASSINYDNLLMFVFCSFYVAFF